MRDLKDRFTRLPPETATGPFGDPSAPGDLPQGFSGDSDGKESICKAGDPGAIPGPGKILSSILAWRSPWTEEPGRLQSIGFCKKSDMTEQLTQLTLSLFFFSPGG